MYLLKAKETIPARTRIEQALKDIPDFYEQLLELKYGIVLSQPHSDEEIADVLNKQNSTNSGQPWDKKSVAAAIEDGLEKLRDIVGDKVVRQFIKQGDNMDCVAELNKAVGDAEAMLKKATVHAYTRHTKNGGVTTVREHNRDYKLVQRHLDWLTSRGAVPMDEKNRTVALWLAQKLQDKGRKVGISNVYEQSEKAAELANEYMMGTISDLTIETPLKRLTKPGDRDGLVQIQYQKNGKLEHFWIDGANLHPKLTAEEEAALQAYAERKTNELGH